MVNVSRSYLPFWLATFVVICGTTRVPQGLPMSCGHRRQTESLHTAVLSGGVVTSMIKCNMCVLLAVAAGT
jgi:hypothetical protein